MTRFSIAILSVTFAVLPAWADTIRVPGDYPAIQMAIDAAQDGDTVLVADGTWTGPRNINLDFHGKAITVRSENGPDACVIDPDRKGSAFNFTSRETADARVEGFTIQHGSKVDGGGIRCQGSSPTIANCVIVGNWAGLFGGGIGCAAGSAPTIIDCTIKDNLAGVGGGVYSDNSSPTIINCSITGNRTDLFGAGGVGAVKGGHLTIIGSTIADNTAMGFAGNGGGIQCNGVEATIRNCRITGNHGTLFGGGIMCANNSSVTVAHCTISGNLADSDGGAIYAGKDSPVIIDSILWGDSPEEIFVTEGSPEVTYSDVDGGWSGKGNIDRDPRFVEGPRGDFYLSQRAAGQPANSPCVDAGSDKAKNLGMDALTTRTDHVTDRDVVDMGFHYLIGQGEIECGLIKKLKAKCRGEAKPFKVKATVKSKLPKQTLLTLLLDGERPKSAITNRSGKAKAKWNNVESGNHKVCINECPDICKSAKCEP